MASEELPHEEAGQGTVSRRAILGATFGGVGAAALVGIGAATMWPDTKTTTVAAGTDAGAGGMDHGTATAPTDGVISGPFSTTTSRTSTVLTRALGRADVSGCG